MTTSGNQLQFEIVLIQQCVDGDRKAQHKLYNLYSSKMYAICMRYASNAFDAQEILQIGFIKVFKKLDTFRGEGSLEGWIKRIFIFTCIDFTRQAAKERFNELDKVEVEDNELTGYDKIAMEELLKQIQQLPDGYRTVLNLFMVEGFAHKEIGEILGISENTSRSQLARAKVMLQKQLSSARN